MTDLFRDAELGQCINQEDAVIMSFAPGGAITKGAPVKFSDKSCLLYTSQSPRDRQKSRMPSSA